MTNTTAYSHAKCNGNRCQAHSIPIDSNSELKHKSMISEKRTIYEQSYAPNLSQNVQGKTDLQH